MLDRSNVGKRSFVAVSKMLYRMGDRSLRGYHMNRWRRSPMTLTCMTSSTTGFCASLKRFVRSQR